MFWPTTKINKDSQSKFELAVRIAFYLGAMHLKLGDLISIEFREKDTPFCEHISHIHKLMALYQELESSNFSFQEIKAPTVSLNQNKKFSRKYILSDAIDDLIITKDSEFKNTFFCHILSSEELNPDWLSINESYYGDQEHTEFPYKEIQTKYKKEMDSFLERTKTFYLEKNIDYQLFTNEDHLKTLMQFLKLKQGPLV
jgi:hypothetical protein